MKSSGLKALSAEELLSLSQQMKIPVSHIQQSKLEEDYLKIDDNFYVVVDKEDIHSRMLDWLDGIGDVEYLLNIDGFPVTFDLLVDSLKSNIITNHTLFMKDCRRYINDEYNEYKKDYSSYEDFLKNHLYLEVEDLQNIKKLWDSEIIAFVTFSNYEEFMLNAKAYGINIPKIKEEIVKHLFDYDVLGDYGKIGKYVIGKHVVFKKDL